MKEIATIIVYESNSSDEAVAIVASNVDKVSLCFSIKQGGDIEIMMNSTRFFVVKFC